MPGQEKMIMEYYKNNPNAAQSLKGAIYEEKIISLLKSKIKLVEKKLTTKEAEKIISDFNKLKTNTDNTKEVKTVKKSKSKTKK